MAKQYTGVFDVFVDLTLYLGIKDGEALSAALFPAVLKGRWSWIVDNWVSLKDSFLALANGDEDLVSSYNDLQNAVYSYKLGNTQNIIENNATYLKFFSFFSQIGLDTLGLTAEERKVVSVEVSRIEKLDINDFRAMLALLRTKIAGASALIGLGDDEGSKIFGGQNTASTTTSSFKDMQAIEQLISIEGTIEGLIFGLRSIQDRPPNLLQAAAFNTDPTSDVAVKSSYLSYTAVPFFESLESMAQRFLGSSERWYELVTINNLQPPYIDDTGTKFPLFAPGGANTVTISNAKKDYVAVGQKVKVGSYRFREEQRIIERKVENDDGSMTLYLSGAQNLNQLKPADAAYCRIYKPGTVTTGSMILIPFDIRSVQPTTYTPDADYLRRLDKDLLAFGIDLKRDERTGDLVLGPDGDLAYAAGLENVRQALTWKFKTTFGELPFHPGYGMTMGIGTTFFSTESELALWSEVITANIKTDPRYREVQLASFVTTGNGFSMKILVQIGNNSQLLPLAFTA